MEVLGFIHNLSILSFFLISVTTLIVVGGVAYLLGDKEIDSLKVPPRDSVSSHILGLLALILGFSFSMTIDRFEKRRILTIKEANAIGEAYLRSELIIFENQEANKELFRRLVDLRIKVIKSSPSDPIHDDILKLQTNIWNNFKRIAERNRGHFETAYLHSLNNLFMTANMKNFSLYKNPFSFYLLILILAASAVGLMNYDRGLVGDSSHWRSMLFIILFGILFTFIFDMDNFRRGSIQVNQEALVRVKILLESTGP
jgi:hypothetical protein